MCVFLVEVKGGQGSRLRLVNNNYNDYENYTFFFSHPSTLTFHSRVLVSSFHFDFLLLLRYSVFFYCVVCVYCEFIFIYLFVIQFYNLSSFFSSASLIICIPFFPSCTFPFSCYISTTFLSPTPSYLHVLSSYLTNF